jgi:hypothetical protein
MTRSYNITGPERKQLVGAISKILNQPIHYNGAPTFSYQVGEFTINKHGTITGPDDSVLIEDLHTLHDFLPVGEENEEPQTETEAVEPEEPAPQIATYTRFGNFPEDEPAAAPEARHYQAELSDPDYPDRMEIFSAEDDVDAVRQAREFCEGEVVLLELLELDENYNVTRGVDLAQYQTGLCISVPMDGFSPEKLDNLIRLVAAKEPLLKAALGRDALPIQQSDEEGGCLRFPWFDFTDDGERVTAYSQLICAICQTAKEKQRVLAKPQENYANPKFTMRCTLIAWGLVGPEFKKIRALMTKGLSGNSAWSTGVDPRAKAQKAAAPTEAAKAETAEDAAGEALPGAADGGADDE